MNDSVDPAQGRAPGAPGPAAGAGHRRTHPITPLVTGWKIVVGIVAVLLAQNVASLISEFTVTRALIGLGVMAVAVVIAIVFSFLSWWFTTYAVDDDGVALHKGLISRSREFAPRARIESVSVERPLLARLLGLAKVRIEVAGGGESYLDIEYIRAADAEELRGRILQVARAASADGSVEARDRAPAPRTTTEAGPVGAAVETVTAEPGAAAHVPEPGATDPTPATGPAPATADRPPGGTWSDEPGEGALIARIPTSRLVRSLLRDPDFLLGIVAGLVGVAAAVALALSRSGLSLAVVVALVPTFIAVPKYVFGRIESGWGFVSRITERGLRMRRGLANTRTDNIATGRIQRFLLKRPLLWRGQAWTAVTVTVAGIDDSGENGAENALPVGTREELALTIGHLAAPLGTEDDMAALEHLLTARARDIEGLRAPHPVQWIARRTRVTVVLAGAVIHRSGILARRLEIVPRDRIQELAVEDDPFSRRLGTLELKIGVGGYTVALSSLPRRDALALHTELARDAVTLRRYRDRDSWPQPALSPHGVGSPGTAP